jgi:tRNA nucleotidyltransferase (CCA-adding enzyme)
MNLGRQLEKYLPPQLLSLAQNVSQEAGRQGQRAYLVGGIVRDLLLGCPNVDLDLVVEGDAVKLAKRMAETGEVRLLAHHRFGTAKLRYGNFTADLATARKETYPRPGALPVVVPGTLTDDLIRRDFSVNAMAVSLSGNDYGALVDLYKGRSDLEHGLIRILHSSSFKDDATRILRGVRYEQRFGFKFEAQTARLLKRDIPMLDTISGDRIRHEMELTLKEERPELAVRRLGELGVLSRISPALTGDGSIAERFAKARHPRNPTQLPPLYFCLLVYASAESDAEELMARLNMPARLSKAIRDTLQLRTRLRLLDKHGLRPSGIYALLQEYDALAIQANAIASDSPTVRRNLRLFLTKLRKVKTCLNGEELKELGIPPGPQMGEVLRMLHKARLDGEVHSKADEEKLARALYENQNDGR